MCHIVDMSYGGHQNQLPRDPQESSGPQQVKPHMPVSYMYYGVYTTMTMYMYVCMFVTWEAKGADT